MASSRLATLIPFAFKFDKKVVKKLEIEKGGPLVSLKKLKYVYFKE